MCVTNTANRRPAVVSLQHNIVTPNEASLLTQHLTGRNFFAGATSFDNAVSTVASTDIAKNYNGYGCEIPTNVEKPRPKRRRKPQKPGKTAKMNDRQFVKHDYHDHANDEDDGDAEGERRRGGVAVAFPLKLHDVLDRVEADGLAHIVSWQPHGRCFVVHKPKEFVDLVMPKYFRQSKLTSFQRQLNLYGFNRITRGPDAGGYYNELFLRGKVFLCKKMVRTKVKGTKYKSASSPESEPDFYKMQPVAYQAPASAQTMDRDDAYGDINERATASLFGFDRANAQGQPFGVDHVYGAMGSALVFPTAGQEKRSYADRVLDEAVEELLFSNDSSNGGGGLDELQAWDLSNTFSEDKEIEDAQLGMLLEKLLDE